MIKASSPYASADLGSYTPLPRFSDGGAPAKNAAIPFLAMLSGAIVLAGFWSSHGGRPGPKPATHAAAPLESAPSAKPEPSLAVPSAPAQSQTAAPLEGGLASASGASQTADPFAAMVEHAIAQPSLKTASLSGLYAPGADADGFKLVRFVEDAPRYVRRPGTEDRNNTDWSQHQDSYCKGKVSCGYNAEGQFVIEHGDGTRYTQLSYDQSKPIGERNVFRIEDANGNSKIQAFSPLVFDLKGSGVRSSDRLVRFDLAGNGKLQRLHDIASDAGVLVFDADGDGVAGANGRELFGDIADLDGDGKPDGYADGFAALKALVQKAQAQKVLPPGAPAWLGSEDLEKLGKAYGLGMRVGGLLRKTVSLKEAGISGILLSDEASVRTANFDGQGDDVVRREGAAFIRADGSRGVYEDIFFSAEERGLRKIALNKPR